MSGGRGESPEPERGKFRLALFLIAATLLAGCSGTSTAIPDVITGPDGLHSTWGGIVRSVAKVDANTAVSMQAGGNTVYFTLCGDWTAQLTPWLNQSVNLTVIYGSPCQNLVDVYGG
jgi:hypothetical protein